MENVRSVQDIIGNINLESERSITQQLKKIYIRLKALKEKEGG